ncbi:PAS domain S-box protein [Phaeobacter sp. B1627]|uniref:sensor histidine kinase n=1 Tax=Phaeobacter sp. B1627 TaxID=2583809 RepID=UPI00111890A1|nr:PAS domain-containing sensor histidine kinase [Phaeobacter sp. B1627]TNJ44468.1 PAS domain S-box protein [Phaeobacter sp. B1627]
MLMIEKYRLAFDISPVPLLLISGSGEIVLANAGFLDLFGYEASELIGLSVEVLVPEPVRNRHPDLRSAYHRVPTKRSMGAGRDLYGVTKSGTVIPLELGLEPVLDSDEPMALVAAIDIRQRKAHEVRLRQAMDAAASAMVMVNHKGCIVLVNHAASELFQYEERDLLGKRVEMLVPEEFRPVHPVYTSSFMSNRTARSMGGGQDLFARRRDGSNIPVEIALTPVDTPEGQMVMSTIIDLSERVAAAEVMARKNKELEALNVELSHFAYSASHDLKAPLSSIVGLLNICLQDLDDDELDEVRVNIAKVMEISRRSANKIEGILTVARSGRDPVERAVVQLDAVVQDIWLDLTGGKSTTALLLELNHDAPVISEPATIKIIMENLLSNALRYGDPNKPEHRVCVRSWTVDQSLHVSVSDNGVGIPKENHEMVFLMFKRLDDRSGDGLGLALVKKQIDRLGGDITLTSTVGTGAEFSFTLPTEDKELEQNSGNSGR